MGVCVSMYVTRKNISSLTLISIDIKLLFMLNSFLKQFITTTQSQQRLTEKIVLCQDPFCSSPEQKNCSARILKMNSRKTGCLRYFFHFKASNKQFNKCKCLVFCLNSSCQLASSRIIKRSIKLSSASFWIDSSPLSANFAYPSLRQCNAIQSTI